MSVLESVRLRVACHVRCKGTKFRLNRTIWSSYLEQRKVKDISVQVTALKKYYSLKQMYDPHHLYKVTNFTLLRRAAGTSFSDANSASASILVGASLPSSNTSPLLMSIP
jgi:hypothetical protein